MFEHMPLLAEYERLRSDHRKAMQHRIARTTLGSSVMRVFARGTRPDLIAAFTSIPVAELRAVPDEDAFRPWFERHLAATAGAISRRNAKNRRIQPGARWGHGTKVLTIFLREMVAHSRFFRDEEVKRIEPLLYVPLDSITMGRLRDLGIRLPFKRIREIDSARKFYDVQDALGAAAGQVGVPRVWFDDNWGDRDG
jgi:hypothetical protein